ncbi:MAG: WbqC family protein [Muribaculaceae bacterium]|nr:WbqC family protein [Muribaculaceae bacterium]
MDFSGEHNEVIVGSCCAGSVRYYALLLASGNVWVDDGEQKLPLRHSHHRYRILGPNGIQTLTVPLVSSTNAMSVSMRDVEISNHGKWRHLHWGALYSSYGKTPYFDYIAPDLERLIVKGDQRFLLDFNMELDALIVEFADLAIHTHLLGVNKPLNAKDFRGRIAGKRPDNLPIANVQYSQLWADRYGFTPDLSILDLVMNCGRESVFTLMEMTREKGE